MSRKGRISRHHDGSPIIPRVPIIPMLDMAFQLLSFGLYCFDLSADKIEGQLSLSLPKAGSDTPSPVTSTIDLPEEDFTIRVTSDGSGRIGSVELTTTRVTEPVVLPKDIDKLTADLKARVEKKIEVKENPPKLEMQFDPDLNYQLVFELLSAGDAAKFKKVSPNLLGAAPKPMEPKPQP